MKQRGANRLKKHFIYNLDNSEEELQTELIEAKNVLESTYDVDDGDENRGIYLLD